MTISLFIILGVVIRTMHDEGGSSRRCSFSLQIQVSCISEKWKKMSMSLIKAVLLNKIGKDVSSIVLLYPLQRLK
jgi:hypothetical protein